MPKDNALPIVLCADESYVKYASVVMISVLETTQADITFYLLSDSPLSLATQAKLSRIESTYPNASISHSCHSLARFVSLPTQGENDSHITYLRLLLDSILPPSIGKCVYLDCDVLVRTDIARLFSYELHGALLGAVRDLAFNDASSACSNHLGFYFNAGVLLLDMEKWRESKASKRLFRLIATRPEITQGFHDQNLLNECFCDEVSELPFGWNVIAAPPHILRFLQEDSALGEQCGSVANFVKGTTTKVANLPQSLQSFHSPTATPRILEEKSSSRAAQSGVAIHSLESSFAKVDSRARAVDSSMDCHATATALARNDKAAVDCHDLPSKSRNDKNNAICKKVDSRENAENVENSTQDSRIFDKNAATLSKPQAEANEDSGANAQNVSESAKDSRILEIESGFFKPRKEIRLGGLSTKRGDEIHDSSPKAESTKEAQSMLSRHSRAAYDSALTSPHIVHFAAQPKPWGRVCYIKQVESTLELIEYANPYAKQWWEVARKSPFFTEILRAFIAPTLQAYKTKAIFATKTKAPRIYAALHALARLFTPSNPSHKDT
ncbi:glycosyltransferase family 8 protein [Helicobacter canis]|uniref:Lipopolysaccharide 1,3-galactosyltransferase n=1 Tax=Helicobacter canis TaxID=29419 RepID=A0A377J1W0_9HELI|nr:glycosyltransferase family 8 protein [Helicobacter canis]STO96482.1 lipopolysaccharide 1,3-galactosyltransferase [Helicobacter canis]